MRNLKTSKVLIEDILNDIDKGIKQCGEEFLLGIIEIEDKTYHELLQITKKIFDNEIVLLNVNKYSIISMTLVQFAIRDYTNNQFWNEFANTIRHNLQDVENQCKIAFEKFCIQKKLYFHIGNVNKGYVTSILTHAIIPGSSIGRFLEFLSDLYYRDLEEDYQDEEVEELLKYIHRLFTKYLEEEDINLVVQGSKMTIARQQLPKAFRISFVKSYNIVAPIIKRLLFYIDLENYNEFEGYLENDRFDKYFHENYSITRVIRRYYR